MKKLLMVSNGDYVGVLFDISERPSRVVSSLTSNFLDSRNRRRNEFFFPSYSSNLEELF